MSQPDQSPARPLDAEQCERVGEWFQRHGEGVIREVRRCLRKATTPRTGATASAVAQSVWESFMEHHVEEIDLDDENSAWTVLTKAAKRHCEAWNRYGTRHPTAAIGTDLAGQGPGPEAAVMVQELTTLLGLLENDAREQVGQALVRVEVSLGLVEKLQPREREVLGLKLAGNTRSQIGGLLGLDDIEVRDIWQSVRRKAEAIAAESIV